MRSPNLLLDRCALEVTRVATRPMKYRARFACWLPNGAQHVAQGFGSTKGLAAARATRKLVEEGVQR